MDTYVLETRLEGKSFYESSCIAAKLEVCGGHRDTFPFHIESHADSHQREGAASAVQSMKVLRQPIQATKK